MIYIYGLKEIGKSFNDLRWVGQTNNPHTRLIKHKSDLRPCVNKHKTNWIKSVNKNIELIILEETTPENVDAREEFWILDLKNKGFNLLNVKPGGKVSRGFKQRPESIEKRTNTRRKRGNWSKGWKHSEEVKKKMSFAKTGKILSEETRKNMSLVHKGIKFSELHRKNIGLSKRKLTDEQIIEIKNKHLVENLSQRKLALFYNISQSVVFKVLNDKYCNKIQGGTNE